MGELSLIPQLVLKSIQLTHMRDKVYLFWLVFLLSKLC